MEHAIRKPTLPDTLSILAMGIIWGSAFLTIKIAVAEVPPMSVAFIRITIGFAVLVLFCLFTRPRLPTGKQTWVLLGLLAVFNFALPFFLISWAETRISSGVTALIMGVGPVMSVLGAHFSTRDDRITPQKLAGLGLGFAGILVVFGGASLAEIGNRLLPQGAALLAVTSYVASGLIVRRVRNVSSEAMTACIMGLAAALLFPFALVAGIPAVSDIGSDALLALLWLGVVPTGIAFLLRFHLIRKVGLTQVTQGIYVVPVSGLLFGAAFLGEHITPATWLALGLVIAGILVSRLEGRRDRKPEPAG